VYNYIINNKKQAINNSNLVLLGCQKRTKKAFVWLRKPQSPERFKIDFI